MKVPHRWRSTFPARPDRYTAIDVLAWLICVWALIFMLLLRHYSQAGPTFQVGVRVAPIVMMLGVTIMLLAALREDHPDHRPHYRFACLALLVTQALNIIAILATIQPYVVGSPPRISGGFAIYVLVYVSLIFSIGFFVPFWRFPRIPVLRITLDAALLMALTDVLLHLLLPRLIPDWHWNTPLLASAFRLESTLGLFLWYTLLFLRFGDLAVVPLRFWLLGFTCLLLNDALVLTTTFIAQGDENLIRVAIPFWMLNQVLWAQALYRNRHTPALWHSPTLVDSLPGYPPLWQQATRLIVILSTLAVVVAIRPSLATVLWFFCALVSRELLTLFERQQVIAAERQARATLSDRHRELAETNARLVEAQEALFRVNEQLQQIGRYQAEQLERRQVTAAEIAHDMGNILQAIKVTLSLVEATLESAEPALLARLEQYLHSADVAMRMSENLLSTMVAAAQFDAGGLKLKLEVVEPVSLLEEVVEHQQLRAQGRPVAIRLDVPETLPLVFGDPILLTRAFLNIIGNAVKYTAEAHRDGSGQVIVRSAVHAARLTLTIEDNGPGIAPETLKRLGQRFVRGVEGPAAPAGFGVGLSFSRAVVEQHPGGQFEIFSKVGRGTTVIVALEIVAGR